MAIFNDFPYSNLHNENLTWILEQLKKLNAFIEDNPALNPDDFNKNLQEIKSEITTLSASVKNNTDTISELDNNLSSAERGIETNSNNINAHTSEISTLKNKNASLENEISGLRSLLNNSTSYDTSYIVCVGDSYTAGPGSSNGKGWPDRLKTLINPAPQMYTVWNGGGGYVRSGDAGTMSAAIQTAAIPNAENVSLVICIAGINDADDSDTYTGAANFIKAAKEKCPNAKIILAGTPAPYVQSKTKYIKVSNAAILNKANYFDIITCCLSVSDNYKSADDDIHLNDSGYSTVARTIYAKLLGGEYETYVNSRTTSKLGVNITVRSDKKGIYLQAAGILTSINTSGAFENVVLLGARPKNNVGVFGGSTLDTPDVSKTATRPTSCYLTPTGALAIPGSAIKGSTIDIYFTFIPWEALMS